MPVKAKAVIACCNSPETEMTVVCVHMCVQREKDGGIYEPSYEIGKIKDVVYLERFSDLTSASSKNVKLRLGLSKKEFLESWLQFLKYEEMINSGICVVSDSVYYNKLADYLDKIF